MMNQLREGYTLVPHRAQVTLGKYIPKLTSSTYKSVDPKYQI
jgi:hypothetical protein